jgi:hypothetical protein
MIWPLDSIIESKCKCKNDNGAKKIKILDNLLGDMSTAEVGLTFY